MIDEVMVVVTLPSMDYGTIVCKCTEIQRKAEASPGVIRRLQRRELAGYAQSDCDCEGYATHSILICSFTAEVHLWRCHKEANVDGKSIYGAVLVLYCIPVDSVIYQLPKPLYCCTVVYSTAFELFEILSPVVRQLLHNILHKKARGAQYYCQAPLHVPCICKILMVEVHAKVAGRCFWLPLRVN